MKRFTLIWIAGIVLAGAVAAQDATEEEWKLPPPPDNAAINYCLAMALQPRPYDAAGLEAEEFIDSEFAKLPPEALADWPDVQKFLQEYFGPGDTLGALHRGAQKSRCAFDVDYSDGPVTPLLHLPEILHLARRCVAAAKFAEFNGDPNEAAQIYADLMRMGQHVGQDPIMIGGAVGDSTQREVSEEIEGLLSREPPPEAARTLFATLQDIEPRPFDLSAYLHAEAESCGNWLAQLPLEEFLTLSDHFKQYFEALPDDQRKEKLAQWIDEYRAIMHSVAEIVKEPYYNSAPKVRKEEAQVEKLSEDFLRNPKTGNPLVSFWISPLETSARCFAQAEARLGMTKLACAAVLHYHEKGKYPESMDDLAEYFPDGLPKDPFTGENYTYTLVEGWPRVEFDAYEELRQQNDDSLYSIDLSRRRKQDAEALAKFREQMEEPEE